MHDTTDPAASESPPQQATPLATREDFEAIDFEAPLRDVETVDCDDLRGPYGHAAGEADENSPEARVYRLLSAFCGFHLRVEDKATPFGPMLVLADGSRSPIPDDYRGEQNAILVDVVGKIRHPGLRARVADAVWHNDRKLKSIADAAVDAYCACVEAVLIGTSKHRFQKDDQLSGRSTDYLQRALHIAATTTKAKAIPERLSNLVRTFVDRAEAQKALHPFHNAAGLAFRYDLIDNKELASRAQVLATTATEVNVLTRRPVLQLAAQAWNEAGDDTATLECRLAAAEMLVEIADGMNSAIAAIHWLTDAIRELRTIKGTRERRKELEAKLREVQRDSLDEMGSISIPLDIKGLAESTEQDFEGAPLSLALRMIACIARSRPTADLRAEALESAKKTPLATLFSALHVDSDGKTVASAPGASMTGESTEEWYEHHICRHEALHRKLVIAGQFDPARRYVGASFPLAERHFLPIVEVSPFVPPGHEYIFALGFARLFQGDPISAAHLLLPQLENSIRFAMLQQGGDPTIIQSDMTQEDRTLSALIETEREALNAIFGEALVSEIHRLFNTRLGPALRHVWAHGKFSTGHCLSTDVVYACWLIFHITCMSIPSAEWKEYVAPRIDAETD